MIDSLFGGTGAVQSSNIDTTNSLLTGFNALSVSNGADGANLHSGLWEHYKSTENWSRSDGSVVDDLNSSTMKNIFSNKIPNHSQQNGPKESRFNWNLMNAGH